MIAALLDSIRPNLPDLVRATDTLEKNHQRDVLNKVIAQIRLNALRQIEQLTGPNPWHPDSTTRITHSQNRNASVGGTDSGKSHDIYPSPATTT